MLTLTLSAGSPHFGYQIRNIYSKYPLSVTISCVKGQFSSFKRSRDLHSVSSSFPANPGQNTVLQCPSGGREAAPGSFSAPQEAVRPTCLASERSSPALNGPKGLKSTLPASPQPLRGLRSQFHPLMSDGGWPCHSESPGGSHPSPCVHRNQRRSQVQTQRCGGHEST